MTYQYDRFSSRSRDRCRAYSNEWSRIYQCDTMSRMKWECQNVQASSFFRHYKWVQTTTKSCTSGFDHLISSCRPFQMFALVAVLVHMLYKLYISGSISSQRPIILYRTNQIYLFGVKFLQIFPLKQLTIHHWLAHQCIILIICRVQSNLSCCRCAPATDQYCCKGSLEQ